METAICPQVHLGGIPLLGMVDGTINVNGERAAFFWQRLIGGWVLDQQGNSLPATDAS
jgi:hypothetical protein